MDMPPERVLHQRSFQPGDPVEEAAEWVECPHCQSVMLPLREHEVNRNSEFPAVEADLWEFLLWGWTIFVVNFVHGLITYAGRKRKLASLKTEVLPRFPRSSVCPRCFYITRRL